MNVIFIQNNILYLYINYSMIEDKDFNISICSYNLFWKVMKKDSSLLTKKINKENLNILKSNILKNIFLIKNYYNPYFYCFQESESYEEITNLFDKSIYKFHSGYSKPEHILTIWNFKLFEKKYIFDGEFESGRPFSIFIFKDRRFKSFFILINIHSSHQIDTIKNIFEPIQEILSLNQDKIRSFDIKRIIICGDFNRDIGSQISLDFNNSFKLFLNSLEFNFIPFITNNKTCCNLNGFGYNKNYDQVIDTFDKPIHIHQLNKDKWYQSQSSDHVAILAILKNCI